MEIKEEECFKIRNMLFRSDKRIELLLESYDESIAAIILGCYMSFIDNKHVLDEFKDITKQIELKKSFAIYHLYDNQHLEILKACIVYDIISIIISLYDNRNKFKCDLAFKFPMHQFSTVFVSHVDKVIDYFAHDNDIRNVLRSMNCNMSMANLIRYYGSDRIIKAALAVNQIFHPIQDYENVSISIVFRLYGDYMCYMCNFRNPYTKKNMITIKVDHLIFPESIVENYTVEQFIQLNTSVEYDSQCLKNAIILYYRMNYVI